MKVVVIGGGTGLSCLLRGIKYINDIDITAIVTISDDGGSSGKLSHHFLIPAVGDIRQVISAMSVDREELEAALHYRFSDTKTDLDGHPVGNLILLAEILRKKSFLKGITSASKMLNIQGQIVPISNDHNKIKATAADGSFVEGESKFNTLGKPIKKVEFIKSEVGVNKKAIQEIMRADLIIMGIGSLFTSIIPNLIYPEIIDALKKTSAKIFYFANISTEIGETEKMTLADHIKAIEDHTFKGIIDLVILSSTPVPEKVRNHYIKLGQNIVKASDINRVNTKHVEYDLLSFTEQKTIRHDPEKIEKALRQILEKYDFYSNN